MKNNKVLVSKITIQNRLVRWKGLNFALLFLKYFSRNKMLKIEMLELQKQRRSAQNAFV